MPDDANKVIIGRLGAPHGVRGWIKLLSFTDPLERIFEYQPWLLKEKKGWREVKVVGHELQGKGYVIALEGCYDRDAAKLLTNAELAIERSRLPQLPEEGGYYWHDLIGCHVVNEKGEELGQVDQILNTGSNDILILDSKPAQAIPFIEDEYILSVDLAAKIIKVRWEISE